jgi:hypothetical protein
MPTTHHPTIGDTVFFEFMLASAYALLIILGKEHSETLLAGVVESWIDLTAPAVHVLFALVPVPDGLREGALSDTIWVYRHILVACFLIACGGFVRSHRHWRYWGDRLRGPLFAAIAGPRRRRRFALFGYRRMLLGLVAVMFLALFVEAQLPVVADYLFGASWTYIRAPLLTAAAYSFACHAAALRVSLIKTR